MTDGRSLQQVAQMNPREVLTKLKHPAKVAKECAAKKYGGGPAEPKIVHSCRPA